ncbi:MAG: 16S rRNA (guanine(527)-N(7))-methyltransferase RsmG [Bdellovibrionota bacterium]
MSSLEDQKTTLIQGLEVLSIQVEDQQINQLISYGKLLYKTNAKLNLTRIPQERFVVDHVLDSLAGAVNFIQTDDRSLIDLGTGAGLPGIPINIIWPKLKITLIDSRSKKVGFLEKVIRELKLQNIEAVHARAEDLAHQDNYREKYDLACSRALADMKVFLELAVGFVRVGGKIAALKSDGVQAEISQSQKFADDLGCGVLKTYEYSVPLQTKKYQIISTEKLKVTAQKFPRQIKKMKN